jgi:hypothetical protein
VQNLSLIVIVVCVLTLWLSPVIWAWKINHPGKKIITVLALFFGPITFFIQLIILSNKKREIPNIEDPGVYLCNNCNNPYRLSDYLEDVPIFCEYCKSPLERNQNRGLTAST